MSRTPGLFLLWSAAPPETDIVPPPSLGAEDDAFLARCLHPVVRRTRLQGRWLLLEGLRRLELSAEGLRLTRSPLGRPLLNMPGLSISFSYTDRALCLICDAGQPAPPVAVGADWEKLRLTNLPPLPVRNQDPTHSSSHMAREALRQWCVREAVLKAAGLGWRVRYDTIDAGAWRERMGISLADGRAFSWHCLQTGRSLACVSVASDYASLLTSLRCAKI